MSSIGLHFILLVTHYYFDVELVPLTIGICTESHRILWAILDYLRLE